MDDCKQCPEGWVNDGLNAFGMVKCYKCSSGFYQDEKGKTPYIGGSPNALGVVTCKDCSNGQYNDQVGQVMCKSCPVGFKWILQRERERRSAGCAACARGFYEDVEGVQANNNDNDEDGKTNCKTCSSGQYSDQVGSTKCFDCPAGFSPQSRSQVACDECPAGYFANEAGTGPGCKFCTSGRYTASLGALLCIGCPAGQYGLETVGEGGTAITTKSDGCPNKCDLGTWSATIGMPHSTEGCSERCSAGKYANTKGTTSDDACKLCPEGRMSVALGLESALECNKCLPGQHSDAPGSMSCNACEIGMFAAAFGSLRCTVCPVNQYQDELQSLSCKVCAGATKIDDTTDATAHDAPSDCSLSGKSCNKTLRRTEDGNCDKCAPGSEVSPQQTSCRLCPVGKYNDVAGQFCKNCANDNALCSLIAGSISQATSTETLVLQKLQKQMEQESNDNADIHYVVEVTDLNTLQTPKGCQERSKSYFEKTYDGLPYTTTIPIYSTLFAICFTIVVSHRCFPLGCKVVDVMFAKSHYIEVSSFFVYLLLSL